MIDSCDMLKYICIYLSVCLSALLANIISSYVYYLWVVEWSRAWECRGWWV